MNSDKVWAAGSLSGGGKILINEDHDPNTTAKKQRLMQLFRQSGQTIDNANRECDADSKKVKLKLVRHGSALSGQNNSEVAKT